MRIVHVIPAMTWERGGPAGVVAALTRHQRDLGHEVEVFTTDQGSRHGEQPIELAEGVELTCASVFGPDRFAYAPSFGRTLRSRLRSTDVLHVHSIFRYPCLAAVKAAARSACRVVIRPCGVLHRYGLGGRSAAVKSLFLKKYGNLYRSVCDAWHYTSPNERQESWPWEAGENSFILPNGIDPEPFNIDRETARAHVSRLWPACVGSRYVLFLGRLHSKKRVDLLLEAFLAGAPADTKLVVAGPDEDDIWEPLRRTYLADRERADRVVRIGLVTGPAKYNLLAGATLFALPSEHENFGNAVLEALAAGTPVLGSANVDLVRDLANEGLTQLAEMDPEVWASRLAELLSAGAGEASLAQRARESVSLRYGWHQITQRLLEQYAKLS